MRPATPGQSTHVFGCPRLVWLPKLNDSARICIFTRSVNANSLKNERSSWVNRGPHIEFRPTLPNVAFCGRCHVPLTMPFAVSGVAAVLNQPNWLGSFACQSPAMLGLQKPVSLSLLQ